MIHLSVACIHSYSLQACNSCSKLDGRAWMLLNKEWQLNGDLTCNRKLLSRCIILTVLSDKEGIQEGGAALARSATALKVWNFSFRFELY